MRDCTHRLIQIAFYKQQVQEEPTEEELEEYFNKLMHRLTSLVDDYVLYMEYVTAYQVSAASTHSTPSASIH